jgi:hypothetical protein
MLSIVFNHTTMSSLQHLSLNVHITYATKEEQNKSKKKFLM